MVPNETAEALLTEIERGQSSEAAARAAEEQPA